jgi:hypothetical protein
VEVALLLRGESLAVPQRTRGRVPIKAALALLGLGSCFCRAPLGPLGPNGEARVRAALVAAHRAHPELLAPLAEYFELDLGRRLAPAPAPARGAELAGSGR